MLIILTMVLYNELVYLDEWINFHKRQGVDFFYINVVYQSEKDDKIFQEFINKYQSDSGIILSHLDFTHCIHIYHFLTHYYKKHINDWVAIIDVDEFLYSPLENKKITDIIEIYEKEQKYAIGINWKCFGSNNLDKNPDCKVLEKFTRCAAKYDGINFTVKTLVKISVLDIDEILSGKFTIHKYKLKSGYRYHTSSGIDYIEHNKSNYKFFNSGMNGTNIGDWVNRRGFKLSKKKNGIFIKKKFKLDTSQVYCEKNPYLTLNHYIVRSRDEYQFKITNNPHKRDRYNWNKFNFLNSILNTTEDTNILDK